MSGAGTRAWGLLLGLLAMGGLLGCPPEPQPPPPPDGAVPCERLEDCNEARCGLLRACVDGHCEASPSLPVPCRGAPGAGVAAP